MFNGLSCDKKLAKGRIFHLKHKIELENEIKILELIIAKRKTRRRKRRFPERIHRTSFLT
jgi:hypothetical protein